MLVFGERPDKSTFESDEKVNAAREEVRRVYEAAIPSFQTLGDRISFPKKFDGNKDISQWGRFKSDFARAQHGRCAYCELPVIGTQYGDVEHFRPKGAVEILDMDNQGQELSDLSNVRGRKAAIEIGTGYWWDAFSWENYLLSCAICNQSWKQSFFPIEGDADLRQRPTEGIHENELLLHPFEDIDPALHLYYETDGRIRGLSIQGQATIETLGLWRQSLVTKRRKVIESLLRILADITSPNSSDELVRSQALSILERGAPDWPIFPGMTRIVFRQVSGMTWADLEALAGV